MPISRTSLRRLFPCNKASEVEDWFSNSAMTGLSCYLGALFPLSSLPLPSPRSHDDGCWSSRIVSSLNDFQLRQEGAELFLQASCSAERKPLCRIHLPAPPRHIFIDISSARPGLLAYPKPVVDKEEKQFSQLSPAGHLGDPRSELPSVSLAVGW